MQEVFERELLPLALEIGMTPSQFWYDKLYLLDAYVEAYNNKQKNTAIMNGFYTNIAVFSAIQLAFGSKDGGNYYELIEKIEKQSTIVKSSNEESFNEKRNFWSKMKHRKD